MNLIRLDGFNNAADTVLDPKSCIQASTGFKLKRDQVFFALGIAHHTQPYTQLLHTAAIHSSYTQPLYMAPIPSS